MTAANACPECGGPVPHDAPRGLCPRCLMGAAAAQTATHFPAGARGQGPGEAAAVDRAEFLATLRELQLVPAAEVDRLTETAPGDMEGLARGLVRAGKLTHYQAGALLQGKARGLVIGSYIVLGKLGVGGMGVVFKAQHRPSGRVVALKILPPSFGRQGDAVRRFRREFQVASRLNHPNLVAAVEASEDRGVHFMTMEYIPGYDLDRLVVNGGPMALKLALHCAIQASRGLEAAHAQGVIHRDIKPGNIMIDPAGVVRVLDLGLARVIAATSSFGQTAAGSLTETGSYMGSVDFLAPEQANDAKSADGRADIYSLGCTLYFLLAGKAPFAGESMLKRLMAHQSRPAPSLRAARPEVPEALEAVYLRMMAKQPADRPQTISEVVLALEACRTSAREAGDASVDLKTFARTAMKRAPAAAGQGPDDSAFADQTPPPGVPPTEPALNLDDLVADARDGFLLDSIPEQKSPPASGTLGLRPWRRRPAAPVPMLLPILLLLALAAIAFWPRPEPVRPAQGPSTSPAAVPPPASPLPTKVATVPTATPGFQSLWNGLDLAGWEVHPDQPGHWRVEDGVLIGSGPGISHLYTERDDFADVHLRVEARINDDGDGGLIARAGFGPARPEGGPLCPKGYEAQISGNDEDATNLTGSLLGAAGDLVVGVTERLVPPGEWFRLELIVRGNHVAVKVNGRVTADYLDPGPAAPARGRVVLQQFTPGTVVEFRKVEVRELPVEIASAPAPTPAPVPVPVPVPAASVKPLVLLSDDFSVPHVGWHASTPEDLARNPNGAHGYGDGLWQLTVRGFAEYAWYIPGGPYPEVEAEVAVRVVDGGKADPRGGALIHFVTDVPGGKGDRAERGFQVRINGAGRLMLEPSFFTAKAYPNGPWRGPLAHADLRPAGQVNVLKFRVQRRRLELFANGSRVGEPIPFDFDLTPTWLALGADSWSGVVRAEFDRIEIREYTP